MDQPMCCVFNARDSKMIPCRELTYPSWGKGKSSSKVRTFMGGYVSSEEGMKSNDCWKKMRWYIPLTDCFPTLQTSTEHKGSRTWRWWLHRCHIEGEKLMNRMQPETAWKQRTLWRGGLHGSFLSWTFTCAKSSFLYCTSLISTLLPLQKCNFP